MKIKNLNYFFIDLNLFKRTKNRNQICHNNRSRVLQKNTSKNVLIQKNFKKNCPEIEIIISLNLFTFFFLERFRDFFIIVEIFSFLKREERKNLKRFLRTEKIYDFSPFKPIDLKGFRVYFFDTLSPKFCLFYLNSHPNLNFKKNLFQKVSFLKQY